MRAECAIDLSDLHDVEVPRLVRVLFGIGETVILVDPYAHTSRAHVPRMPSLRKRGGSDVPTQIFLTDASASIAGVLFARRSIFNLFPIRTRLAYLAHNPRAHVGFPLAALPLRGEVGGRAAARSRGDALAAWPARATTPLPRLRPFTRGAGVAARPRWPRSSPAPSA